MSLPSYLSADLAPDGATIYVLTLPAGYRDPIYALGPIGGRCEGGLGNYVAIDITYPVGKASGGVFLPGSLGPNEMLSCVYIPAAMAASREFLDGAPLDPATDCRVLSQQPCR